jgi:hypothetical protein
MMYYMVEMAKAGHDHMSDCCLLPGIHTTFADVYTTKNMQMLTPLTPPSPSFLGAARQVENNLSK